MNIVRTCKRCHEEKSIDDFLSKIGTRHVAHCFACRKKDYKIYTRNINKNSEKYKERQKAFLEEWNNKPLVKENRRDSYNINIGR